MICVKSTIYRNCTQLHGSILNDPPYCIFQIQHVDKNNKTEYKSIAYTKNKFQL